MNRFRSRKKSRAGDEPTHKPSTDSDVPSLPSFPSMPFKRSKKAQQEPDPMPRLDLATALPSTNDFRTSLMMPNLSARFSMLREQDDPNSKLGKANDDSVLFPKRASRLNLFNHDLMDIAEAASLNGSVRPPFAKEGRMASYGSGDGYVTDDDGSRNGSMMGRPKHGEGNNLFGGRQKIYKISTGGSASQRNYGMNDDRDVEASKTMGGRALFSDDVAKSSFQKLRQKDRQERGERKERPSQDDEIQEEPPADENDIPNSPSIAGYNKKRETTSSTASGPSNIRTSTAATSVASQSTPSLQASQISPSVTFAKPIPSPSLDRSFTKTRRLYGQGLDQHMHDQQSSALTRLDTIQRQRANNGTAVKRLSQSRSATGLDDKYHRSGPLYASNNFRAASPVRYITPPGAGEFDLGLGSGRAVSPEHTARPLSPPLSRPMSPMMGIGDETSPLATALQPKDRGKATALGAFNKPTEQYSEHQYTQRQMQLQNGRSTPTQGRGSPSPTLTRDSQEADRARKSSRTSFQSRSGSTPHVPNPHVDEPAIRSVVEASSTRVQVPHAESQSDEGGTFLAGTSSSELSSSEAEDEAQRQPGRQLVDMLHRESMARAIDERRSRHDSESSHASPPFQHQHGGRVYMDLSEEDVPDSLSQRTAVQPQDASEHRIARSEPMDSPTLGPMVGLRGLIKAHLRNDSGQSSIYPSESPGPAPRFASYNLTPTHPVDGERTSSEAGDRTPIHDSMEPSQWNGEPSDITSPEDDDTTPPWAYGRARQILEQATALRNHESEKLKQMLGDNKAQRVLGGEAPRFNPSHSASWKDQVNKIRHSRGASTETQQEREEFANELAERRKRVQDNLAGWVGSESEPASPMPGGSTPDISSTKPSNAFAMLRSKGSHTSLHHDKNSKALKMLGINEDPLPSSRSTIWNDGKERALRGLGHGPKSPTSLVSAAFHFQRTPPGSRAGPDSIPSHSGRKPSSSHSGPSPPSSRSSDRDRSSPEGALGKWRHRNGRTRDDAKKEDREPNPPLPSRNHSDGYAIHVDNPLSHHYSPAFPRSASAMSTRPRSPSRSASTPGSFDAPTPLLPIQTTLSNPKSSPRPSPSAPIHFSHPFSPHTDSSPTMITPSPLPSLPAARKRSVNKSDISDPTFLSSTSSIPTVALPDGASLRNGMEAVPGALPPPPPVPPINPRRNRPVGRAEGKEKEKDKEKEKEMEMEKHEVRLLGRAEGKRKGEAGAGGKGPEFVDPRVAGAMF